jgi:hypothetical protein
MWTLRALWKGHPFSCSIEAVVLWKLRHRARSWFEQRPSESHVQNTPFLKNIVCTRSQSYQSHTSPYYIARIHKSYSYFNNCAKCESKKYSSSQSINHDFFLNTTSKWLLLLFFICYFYFSLFCNSLLIFAFHRRRPLVSLVCYYLKTTITQCDYVANTRERRIGEDAAFFAASIQ